MFQQVRGGKNNGDRRLLWYRKALMPIPLHIHNLRSGKAALQYSQDFGSHSLSTAAAAASAHDPPPTSGQSLDESGSAQSSAMLSSMGGTPLNFAGILNAQPALDQVAALEAAMEAVLASLEEASSSSQSQMDAAAAAKKEVTDLLVLDTLST